MDPTYRDALAAQVYAALGYAVYPTTATSMANTHGLGRWAGKDGKRGYHLATTDRDLVAQWNGFWARPDTNIAVRTGRASRLVVVDLDGDDGLPPLAPLPSGNAITGRDLLRAGGTTTGLHALEKWEAEAGVRFPRTATVNSPSGGDDRQHLWARLPEDWAQDVVTRTGWLPGLDLLWDRHAVKAPPSIRAAAGEKVGGQYRWTTGCPCQVPEAPRALLDAVVDTPSATPPRGGRGVRSQQGGTGVPVEVYLRDGIPIGQQNTELHRVATSLARRRRTEHQIAETLRAIVDVSEQDPSWPWTDDDLAVMAQRAVRWVASTRERERADAALLFRWAQNLRRPEVRA